MQTKDFFVKEEVYIRDPESEPKYVTIFDYRVPLDRAIIITPADTLYLVLKDDSSNLLPMTTIVRVIAQNIVIFGPSLYYPHLEFQNRMKHFLKRVFVPPGGHILIQVREGTNIGKGNRFGILCHA